MKRLCLLAAAASFIAAPAFAEDTITIGLTEFADRPAQRRFLGPATRL